MATVGVEGRTRGHELALPFLTEGTATVLREVMVQHGTFTAVKQWGLTAPPEARA